MVHDLLGKSPAIKRLNLDCVVLTEVIEHIFFEHRFKVIANILGFLRPKCLIVTTPNYDFNYYFNDGLLEDKLPKNGECKNGQKTKLGLKANPHFSKGNQRYRPACVGDKNLKYSFRNDDHKYEPTRAQFNHFAKKCLKKWWGCGYNLTIEGVGVHEKFETERGYATQVAIFLRKDLSNVGESEAKAIIENEKKRFIRRKIQEKSHVIYDESLIRQKFSHVDLYLNILQLSR